MLALLLAAVLPAAVLAGAPIPTSLSQVGWELGSAGAPMSIDVWGDFQCPDTKTAWDGWLADFRAAHGPSTGEVSIVFHPFPLPYHKNGFDAAQAAYVMTDALQGREIDHGDRSRGSVGRTSASRAFVKVADALFAGQAAFQTDVTVNISQTQLFANVLAPIAAKVGVDRADFLPHMNNDDASNAVARVAWKSGCARGVSGTPTFAANGVISDELASWTLAQWEAWLKAGGHRGL